MLGGTTMPLVPAKCTQCGASLQVDNSLDAAVCQFCNTPFIVEKAINNYTVDTQSHPKCQQNLRASKSAGRTVAFVTIFRINRYNYLTKRKKKGKNVKKPSRGELFFIGRDVE